MREQRSEPSQTRQADRPSERLLMLSAISRSFGGRAANESREGCSRSENDYDVVLVESGKTVGRILRHDVAWEPERVVLGIGDAVQPSGRENLRVCPAQGRSQAGLCGAMAWVRSLTGRIGNEFHANSISLLPHDSALSFQARAEHHLERVWKATPTQKLRALARYVQHRTLHGATGYHDQRAMWPPRRMSLIIHTATLMQVC